MPFQKKWTEPVQIFILFKTFILRIFLSKARIFIIRSLINLNEEIFFYPKLKKIYNSLNKNKKLKLLVDIGVNRGQSIRFFKKINSDIEIFGFEPNTRLFNDLVNKKIKNLKIFNMGCSNINGELIFKENVIDESSTFEKINENSKWLQKKAMVIGKEKDKLIKRTYRVNVIRLNEFIISNLTDRIIDVIKVDVEGHEYKVLEGLFGNYKLRVRFIQIEIHDDDLYENHNELINNILKKNGFIEVFKVKHGFGNFYDLIYKNLYD